MQQNWTAGLEEGWVAAVARGNRDVVISYSLRNKYQLLTQLLLVTHLLRDLLHLKSHSFRSSTFTGKFIKIFF